MKIKDARTEDLTEALELLSEIAEVVNLDEIDELYDKVQDELEKRGL